MSDPLADFITARLAEDEAMARSASPGQWAITDDDVDGTMIMAVNGPVMAVYATGVTPAALPNAAHIARHDPARVLREVTAKRAMVARHELQPDGQQPWCIWCTDDRHFESWPCPDIRDLASTWSDHPDYHAEWQPAL